MSKPQPTLEELLLEQGLLDPEQLERASLQARDQHKSIEQVIREEKLLTPEPLAQLKAKWLKLPYVDLQTVDINPIAMRGISERAAATYQFLAFSEDSNTLHIAMASPENYQALEAVRFIATKRELTPKIYCASPEGIERATAASPTEETEQALRDFGKDLKRSSKPGKRSAVNNKAQQYWQEAPINKIVAVILRHAIDGLASNIHIEPSPRQLRVRYRIADQLHTSLLLPISALGGIASRIKMLANMRITESELPQQGRFSTTVQKQSYSIRVTTLPTLTGEKITLHLTDTSQKPPTLDELGLGKQQVAILDQHLHAPAGLVIIVGPDGAGRSTTLFAALAHINNPDINIATLEDPVEYEIPGVNQTQIHASAGLTFTKALRQVLRQDADVIMLEAITESPTAQLVTQGALAGHLILSTLSASDAVSSIAQLLDFGLSPYLITSSVRLLVAQRLVPKICQECREETDIPRNLQDDVKAELKNIPDSYLKDANLPPHLSFFDSQGCDACQGRKTRGQIGIFEVVPLVEELRSAIMGGTTNEDALRDIVRNQDYISMRQDGLLKALQGVVRYVDVLRVTT